MMKGLDFQHNNFFRQDLSHWFLVGANLYCTSLYKANLRGANLGGAKLAWTNLRGALYNKYTVFPDGFDPVAAGMNKVDTLF